MLRKDCYNFNRCAIKRTGILSIANHVPNLKGSNMVINKIITENELNYIETLYLYCNIQDFATEINFPKVDVRIPIEDIQSRIVYRHTLAYYYDTLLSSAEYIGESNGRMWYKLPNYRLGIMEHDKAKKSNQYNIEIQYEQSHMFSLEPNLKGLDLPFGDELNKYHIKRVDISQIVKTKEDYLTHKKYISPYRVEDRITKNGKVETVYLGHRKNGNVFRMYNKTIELMTDNKDHPIDYKKIELFSKYFGDVEDLYTFELELHRKYIKKTFGIDTLEDLEKVYKVYNEIVGKIGIYEDNDRNRKLAKQNHRDRIKCLYFTEYKEFKRTTQKRYKPSKYYAIDKAVNAVETYSTAIGNLTEAEKILILDEISSRLLNKDIEINIGSSSYDEMKEKHETMRLNQSNDLEIEAKRAFRAVVHNPNPFLE